MLRPVTIKPAPKGFDQTSLMLMGAVARSLQIAGALESMLDISVRYSNERVAFEKKISKFQAVQHNLAKLAGEAAAALAAASSAADTIANSTTFDDAVFLEAASAKIRCSEAAEKGAAIAHQVHGAIGFTIEHILHRYSLRALAWRDDFGHESWWAVELGKMVAARGADELWPLVASRWMKMESESVSLATSPVGRGRIWREATDPGEGLRSINRAQPLTRRCAPTSPRRGEVKF